MPVMRNKFTSKIDAFQRSKGTHLCIDCRYSQSQTFGDCPQCQSKNRKFFPSKTELKRAASLLLLQDAGEINSLRFHPRYDLIVNGRKIGTYVADAEYRRSDGKIIHEDTKSPEFVDKLSQLKIKLFEAIYGVEVTIPQRKTGRL